MLELIERSSKARTLAFSLWEFFDRKLICRRPDIDLNHPNTFHLDLEGFLISRQLGDLRPELVIRQNSRQEVGLVHELLHLNLIPLGFPSFRIWADDDETWNLAGGIINNAEHVPMLPIFNSLGYAEHEFLGPAASHTARELRVFEDIEKLKQSLLTPRQYGSSVSSYLASRSIKHGIVWIAEIVSG
jgi:hypothetical protein